MLINNDYEILIDNSTFVDFKGVKKDFKDKYLEIILEDNNNIICSYDHIFIAGNKNIIASNLKPDISYLSTLNGDFTVKKVIKHNKPIVLYDIVESSIDYKYIANNIISHNCSFLGSGDNFIAEEYLIRIDENEVKIPIRQEYTDLNMWIWEDPIPGEEYLMALDASPGHGEDNSTLNMLKINTIIEEKIITKNGISKKHKIRRHKVEQVAEYYGKLTPQMLAEIAYQYGKRYNNAYAVVDITGGYGVQTIEKLIEFGYDDIHYAEVTHKPSRDRLHGYVKKGQKKMPDGNIIQVDLIPGFFIGNNRPSVLLELQRAIHLEDIIIHSVRTLSELKTFITVAGNRVADHKRTFHDDSIMGLAIGLYVLNFELDRYNVNKEATKKMLDAMVNINDKDYMKKRELNEKNNLKLKHTPPKNINNPDLNLYLSNAWLFEGLNKK